MPCDTEPITEHDRPTSDASAGPPRIGIANAGQMGAAIGALLVRHGDLEVLTALDGRSDATRARAADAGLRDVGDLAALVREVDVLLSVLRPSAAPELANEVAFRLRASPRPLLFVDCNAISPARAVGIGRTIEAAGGVFVDAAVQSAPTGEPGLVVYASGPHAARLSFLRDHGVDLRLMSGPIGQASALDLVLGGASKLFEAAAAQIYLAAHHWGLEDLLEERHARLVTAVEHLASFMPERAARWAEEMAETARVMADNALPRGPFDGAADVLNYLAASDAVREGHARAWPPTQREIIALIAEDIEQSRRRT
jgi:hypothetical protein